MNKLALTKPPKRIRMVRCPYCADRTPVDRAHRCSETGELLRYTICAHCFCMINNEFYPGELVEAGSS